MLKKNEPKYRTVRRPSLVDSVILLTFRMGAVVGLVLLIKGDAVSGLTKINPYNDFELTQLL